METTTNNRALKQQRRARIFGWEAIGCFVLTAILFFLPISFEWMSRFDVTSSRGLRSFFTTGLADASEWGAAMHGDSNVLTAVMIAALLLLVVGVVFCVVQRYLFAFLSGTASVLCMMYMILSIRQVINIVNVSGTAFLVIAAALLAAAASCVAWRLTAKSRHAG